MMRRYGVIFLAILVVTIHVWGTVCSAPEARVRPGYAQSPQVAVPSARSRSVITQLGDTTWIQVHSDTTRCPGDPWGGHGGEATGGPDGSETWCFESADWLEDFDPSINGELVTTSDSCGTLAPWDINCFSHVDVRSLPSQMGINYWHLDTYRTESAPYCGSYCLWCGSGPLWDGEPVECDTWSSPPGYGNQWDCIIELSLPDTFLVSQGCTLFFDPRYDTECKYDYFYVDFHNGIEWITLATFNASSNNPGPECGPTTGGNPDYWGNTDTGQPATAAWQARTVPDLPAFYGVIPPETLLVTHGPEFRWRFTSDAARSDADGMVDTDGGAFVDNVWVYGNGGTNRYCEDFEHADWDSLAARGWSKPDPDPWAQAWHLQHDPDPLFEGADGGLPEGCMEDSSLVWRARPPFGFPGGATWRSRWYYRLRSPRIPISNTGCVVQYDEYLCTLDYTCDYGATMVRFYNSQYDRWCPWINVDGGLRYGCPEAWNIDKTIDLSQFYDSPAESLQIAWDFLDTARPGDFCHGKHSRSDFQVDNVSVGFFDGEASMFSTRSVDLLHDTMYDLIAGYNSFFDAYDTATVIIYSAPSPPPLPPEQQFNVDVVDKNGLVTVDLWGSIDRGLNWLNKPMILDDPYDPARPDLGGTYYGTWDHTDFGFADGWPRSAEIWYYVRACDSLGSHEYFPSVADPTHPGHSESREAYFSFSILPAYPPDYTGSTILLVDDGGCESYDWAPCLENLGRVYSGRESGLEDIYERTLADAGYCYDKFDVNGMGAHPRIEPIDFFDYDAVVWFMRPNYDEPLLAPAMEAIKAYLAGGGKVVLAAERLAYVLAYWVGIPPYICDEFLYGIMGCEHLDEMEEAYSEPYVYLVAESSVDVFGNPVAVELDSLLLYRGCPGAYREMSHVVTVASPWDTMYTSQSLLSLAHPAPTGQAAIYTEYNGQGQCVFLNMDLGAMITHEMTDCDGTTPEPAPNFSPGHYHGRVDLMLVILEDLFGLPSPQEPGGGGTADIPREDGCRWNLSQSSPNPCVGSVRITYGVAEAARVKISIYNVRGQAVLDLVDEEKAPGRYTATWDGTTTGGSKVPSGVYFYKMEAGGYRATKKMLVIQ